MFGGGLCGNVNAWPCGIGRQCLVVRVTQTEAKDWSDSGGEKAIRLTPGRKKNDRGESSSKARRQTPALAISHRRCPNLNTVE